MMGNTHRAFGLAASTACFCLLRTYAPAHMPFPGDMAGNLQLALTEVSVVVFSSAPDVDKLLGATHRGLTHALWIPLALLAGIRYVKGLSGLWYLPYVTALLLGFFLGYLFHLLGDAFSVAGVAWLYPIQQYKRYPNGAFHVKGFRGPFLPVYHAGDRSFWFMPILWWVAAIGLNMFLWGQITGLF